VIKLSEDVREYAKIYEKLVELEKETENLYKDIASREPEELTQTVYKQFGKLADGLRMFVEYLISKDCKHLAEDFVGFLAMNFLMIDKVKSNKKLAETFEKLDEDNLKLFLILTSLDAAFRKQIMSLM
jgi:hypothetical protein